jgi:hypothetical protein
LIKNYLCGLALLLSATAHATTLYPIQLINPSGSTANQVILSTGSSTAPVWGAAPVSGILPVANGGTGVATLTGLAFGNGTSAFTPYAGTSCTNQFTRSLNASGVATCASVANADLVNSAVTVGSTSVSLGATITTIAGLSLTSPTLTTPAIGAATGASLSVTGQLTSTVATGTSPIVVSSTTNVANLNASSLSGATFPAPGPIGSTTASTGKFTTVNGNTITTGTGTLTLAAAKTVTINNTLTLAGTDATTITFPSTSSTVARTDAGQTFTGAQTVTGTITASSGVIFSGGSFAAGEIYTNTTNGLIISGTTGNSSTDIYIANNAGTSIINVPAGTLNTVFGGSISPTTTGGIVGTTTANNANAGSVGEYTTNTTNTTSLTTGTTANATSLVSLPAGDWDITGVCAFTPAGSTIPTLLQCGINTTSATIGGVTTYASNGAAGTGNPVSLSAPTTRENISTATTIYLVATGYFSVSTMTVNGFIRARRVR